MDFNLNIDFSINNCVHLVEIRDGRMVSSADAALYPSPADADGSRPSTPGQNNLRLTSSA